MWGRARPLTCWPYAHQEGKCGSEVESPTPQEAIGRTRALHAMSGFLHIVATAWAKRSIALSPWPGAPMDEATNAAT
ncbi:hypothetical protein GCM10023317_05750 [Actinopolymorpha pittospori]